MVKNTDDEEQIFEDHTVGAMGILSTLETILGLLEDHPEIISKVEPVVRNCILTIFDCYSESNFAFIFIIFYLFYFRFFRGSFIFNSYINCG